MSVTSESPWHHCQWHRRARPLRRGSGGGAQAVQAGTGGGEVPATTTRKRQPESLRGAGHGRYRRRCTGPIADGAIGGTARGRHGFRDRDGTWMGELEI